MKKKLTRILGIFLVILVVVITGAYFSFKTIESNLNQLKELKISNVDISKVPDGIYSGSYKVFPITAEVKVTIKNHKITEIELVKHSSGQGAPAEIIPGKVVEAQSLEIDTITGATYSSKVILKAIENALNNTNK